MKAWKDDDTGKVMIHITVEEAQALLQALSLMSTSENCVYMAPEAYRDIESLYKCIAHAGDLEAMVYQENEDMFCREEIREFYLHSRKRDGDFDKAIARKALDAKRQRYAEGERCVWDK